MAKRPSPAARRPRAAKQPRGAPVVARILDVTLAHLARHGFSALSVPDVAAEAGVNKTSVYRRWPTKLELVRAALARSMGHAALSPDTGALRSDMLAVARGALAFVESPQGTAVLRMLVAEGADPEVQTLATSILASQERAAPRAVVARAVERGELPRGFDAGPMLRALAGAIFHRVFIEHERVTPGFLEDLVDLVLDGARPRR